LTSDVLGCSTPVDVFQYNIESTERIACLQHSDMTFRAQLQGFFLGFGVVGGIAMYQLQKDMWSSHRMIMTSVRSQPCLEHGPALHP
jgi:formate/nitrite transporter FocA (FNT family)